MTIIDNPVEQTTAATDLLLALVAVACLALLIRLPATDSRKIRLWAGAFGLLAVAALLGAVAHGLVLSPAVDTLIWHPIFLALGWTIALFVAGSLHDMWGPGLSRPALPLLLLVGAGFFLYTVAVPGTFLPFILYEVTGAVFALLLYLALAFRRGMPGAGWMVTGILITILAAAVQATEVVRFTLIWEFDHNGAFHLLQIPGILCLLQGLRQSLAVPPEPEEFRR